MTYQLMLKLPIEHILRGAILRGFVETSHMPLHVGGDFFNFFTFIAYNNTTALRWSIHKPISFFIKVSLPMFGPIYSLEIDIPSLDIRID
jgi:hypothetical protein